MFNVRNFPFNGYSNVSDTVYKIFLIEFTFYIWYYDENTFIGSYIYRRVNFTRDSDNILLEIKRISNLETNNSKFCNLLNVPYRFSI